MKRFLLLPLLLILTTCDLCHAGYSIHTPPAVPQWITVNGVAGPEQRLGNEPAPPPGYGREVCRPDNYNQYSIDATRRTRIYEDAYGVAKSIDLFAACPQIRQQRAKEIRTEGARRLEALPPYAPAERDTWPQQQAEAVEYRKNAACPCAMIRQIATGRGITLESLVMKIEENIALYPAAAGAILGQQQRLLDRIDAEQDFEQLLRISW